MAGHSKEIINKFCNICDKLMQTWQMRKYLFDENPNVEALKSLPHRTFFYRLQGVLQENWLHQLAKLHDPAVQGGARNLSLDYIIDYGEWNPETKEKLRDLKMEMLDLAKTLKNARNKILSHNDLDVVLESKKLGGFDSGADEHYFSSLCKFASLVRESTLGDHFRCDTMVRNDVRVFMKTFLVGLQNFK